MADGRGSPEGAPLARRHRAGGEMPLHIPRASRFLLLPSCCSPLGPPPFPSSISAPPASTSSSLPRWLHSLPLCSLAVAPGRGGGSATGSTQLRVRRMEVTEAAARMVAGDGLGANRGGGRGRRRASCHLHVLVSSPSSPLLLVLQLQRQQFVSVILLLLPLLSLHTK